MAFTNDAAHLVIEPIERMMSTVTVNRILSLRLRKEGQQQVEAEKEVSETMLLARTIKKIGGCFRLEPRRCGCRDYRSEHGRKNGELNAMVPGKLITSIFGFCIIDDFTETCMYLGKDITRYINTVAGVVHRNAMTTAPPTKILDAHFFWPGKFVTAVCSD